MNIETCIPREKLYAELHKSQIKNLVEKYEKESLAEQALQYLVLCEILLAFIYNSGDEKIMTHPNFKDVENHVLKAHFYLGPDKCI